MRYQPERLIGHPHLHIEFKQQKIYIQVLRILRITACKKETQPIPFQGPKCKVRSQQQNTTITNHHQPPQRPRRVSTAAAASCAAVPSQGASGARQPLQHAAFVVPRVRPWSNEVPSPMANEKGKQTSHKLLKRDMKAANRIDRHSCALQVMHHS